MVMSKPTFRSSTHARYFLILDMRDCFTCSFTEFYPFTPELYYFSTFKDFPTPHQGLNMALRRSGQISFNKVFCVRIAVRNTNFLSGSIIVRDL